MAKTYTYSQFALDVIAVISGELELTQELAENIIDKANDLAVQQAKKAEYAATHPSKSKAKGASEKTKAMAAAIKGVLTSEPMTAAEIASALGTDLTALQVANAVKYIDGAVTSKVVRETVSKTGLKSEKFYTAYALA